MRIEQERVELFMSRIGDVVNEKPTLIDNEEANRRMRFIIEEAEEYREANVAGNLVEVADAIADLAYVVLGAAVSHGIDLQPIFDEVHKSNMTKTPLQHMTPKVIEGEPCSEKRCVKGSGYRPPRIAELLLLQTTGVADGHPSV